MNVSEAIRNRRSIRKYKEGVTIPREDIEKILEAAMMAPSAVNLRAYEFVVVEDMAIREKITQVCPASKSITQASLAIVVCGSPKHKDNIPEEFWIQDCSAATENILLQALELGYGTCWCGIHPFPDKSDKVAQILEVSSIPFSVIAVGIADEAPNARGFYEADKVKFI